MSANGRFLVVSTFVLEKAAGAGGGQQILGQTFEVTTRDTFINAKDRLAAPNRFFSESGWTVTTKFSDAHLTYWPIVSDDGATLVLVGVTFAEPRAAVLMIYRRNGVEGALVRSFALAELWSESEIYPQGNRMMMFTDASPQWFAGGSFAFSDDGELLLYMHASGAKTVIRLKDGTLAAARD